jgi:hypothetical protein
VGVRERLDAQIAADPAFNEAHERSQRDYQRYRLWGLTYTFPRLAYSRLRKRGLVPPKG